MARTSAERAKKYRERKKSQLLKSATAEQKQKNRKRKQIWRNKLNSIDKKRTVLKQREYRRKKITAEILNPDPAVCNRFNLSSPYKASSSAGKAIAKAKAALPENDEMRKYVWQRIGLEFGYIQPSDIKVADRRLESEEQMRHREQRDEVAVSVKQFYLRRDISYTTPGMSSRDHVIVKTATGKEKLKKHFLTMYQREAFAIFCDENHDEISFSTFCKLRPENVLLLKNTPQEQCLCEKHANFQFALEAIGINYDFQFWENVMCDTSPNSNCWKNVCKECCNGKLLNHNKSPEDTVTRSAWKKQADKRIQRVTEEATVEAVVAEIQKLWKAFVNHVNLKRIQFQEHKRDQETPNLRILNVDFAMNFTPEPQQEIQSALWSRSSITLFTAAAELNGIDQSILLVSDYKHKEKKAVFTFLDLIYNQLEDVKNNDIKEVIWSDGAASEFKNQYMLCILRYLATKYNKEFTWKFFCTSHGKGKCDAIGGKAKMVVRSKLLAQGSQIVSVNCAQDFARIAKLNLPNVTIREVTEREIVLQNNSNPIFEESNAYPGISQLHIFTVGPDGVIASAKNAEEFKSRQ